MFVNKSSGRYRELLLLMSLFCIAYPSGKAGQKCTFCYRSFVFSNGEVRPIARGFPCPARDRSLRCGASELRRYHLSNNKVCYPADVMIHSLWLALQGKQ